MIRNQEQLKEAERLIATLTTISRWRNPNVSPITKQKDMQGMCVSSLRMGIGYFLNYAYLISGEYEHESGKITLTFTSQTVVIEGVNLLDLFDSFCAHLPQRIKPSRIHYRALSEGLKISAIQKEGN